MPANYSADILIAFASIIPIWKFQVLTDILVIRYNGHSSSKAKSFARYS